MQKTILHSPQKILLIMSIFFIMLTLWFEIYFWANKDFPDGENNIVFMLDVSQSMNVVDMWNYSRLDASKRKIIDIMRETPWNNYAISIFAGEPLKILPFTQDIGLISTFLLWLDSWNITKQGSNLEAALITWADSFNENQSWKIILLSDGSDEELSISRKIKNIYADQNLELIILWVWTKQWWYIPSNNSINPYKMYEGIRVTSILNNESLLDIADVMWGIYYDIDDFIDYATLWQANRNTSFTYIFISFIISWLSFLSCIYNNIFTKPKNIWNIN